MSILSCPPNGPTGNFSGALPLTPGGDVVDRARTVSAWILLAGSIVGWPVSALTVASGEPRFVLGLSWMAIIIEAANLLTASQVREGQRDKK